MAKPPTSTNCHGFGVGPSPGDGRMRRGRAWPQPYQHNDMLEHCLPSAIPEPLPGGSAEPNTDWSDCLRLRRGCDNVRTQHGDHGRFARTPTAPERWRPGTIWWTADHRSDCDLTSTYQAKDKTDIRRAFSRNIHLRHVWHAARDHIDTLVSP